MLTAGQQNAGVPMMNFTAGATNVNMTEAGAQRAFAGEAERAGLKNDDDVMAMIKELREVRVVK